MKSRHLKIVIILFFVIATIASTSAEPKDSTIATTYTSNNLGFGMGLDYGGFGGKLTIHPNKYFALCAGVGFNIVDIGYNIGSKYRFSPDKRYCPYASLSYGYTGAIKILNRSEYDKVFHSAIFGLGMELHFIRKTKNFLNIEVLFPIDRGKMLDYIDDLKNNHSINFEAPMLPFNISFGYHFSLQ